VSRKGESVLEVPDISKQAKQLEEHLLWLKTSAYRDSISLMLDNMCHAVRQLADQHSNEILKQVQDDDKCVR